MFFSKIKSRVKSHPTYVVFLRERDKVAEVIHDTLLIFFTCIGPFCAYFCIKNQKDESIKTTNIPHGTQSKGPILTIL